MERYFIKIFQDKRHFSLTIYWRWLVFQNAKVFFFKHFWTKKKLTILTNWQIVTSSELVKKQFWYSKYSDHFLFYMKKWIFWVNFEDVNFWIFFTLPRNRPRSNFWLGLWGSATTSGISAWTMASLVVLVDIFQKNFTKIEKNDLKIN